MLVAAQHRGDRLAGAVPVARASGGVAHREYQPLDPHDRRARDTILGARRAPRWRRSGHEHAVGRLELAQRLQRHVLGIAGPDADADQRAGHAGTSRALAAIATSRWATSGRRAQWVCR